MIHESATSAQLKLALDQESQFVNFSHQLLDGFKELRLNQKKSDSFFDDFKKVITRTRDININTEKTFLVDELIFLVNTNSFSNF